MKFSQLTAFEKHLKEAGPHNFSHVYMVVASTEFERRQICSMIASALLPDATSRFEGGGCSLEQVVAQLNTLSLFGKRPLIILEGLDKFKKGELPPLVAYLARPSPFSFLILSAATFKAHQELYQKAIKEVILLDLSEEKPWEKEKRLRAFLLQEAALSKKALAPDLISYLLAEVGPDMATLSSELFKLITYVGERPSITLADARKISSGEVALTGWQIAEQIAWDKKPPTTPVDTSLLIPLIGQLRYHFQLGMQIAEGGTPYLKPVQAEKFSRLARSYGIGYFRLALDALFDLELSAKSSGTPPTLLLELFTCKLHHAHPTA